ncbi:MAG: glycosyltransferase [Polyangiaceae bacterium]|nr:glycosyltransferase [Polyangiaceae bacterium]
MSRVVVFGLGPMRWEQSTRLFALGLRTWHFARALARAGHDVLLVSIRGHAYEGWPPEKETYVQREGVRVWSVSEHVCHERPHLIRSRVLRFGPDCVVGVNRDPAAVAVNFAGELPLWADINGDPMAEAQAKAHALAHDDDIPEWHRKFITVLRRADRFSTCSRAQRLALIGQLGLFGRLTAKNDGYELVAAVPNSIDDDELAYFADIAREQRRPSSAFRLLWSGGFNTWADPRGLFAALEAAMSQLPQLSFVSTGGGIAGHHAGGYAEFERAVARSRYRSRFELSGWVQTRELHGYYQAADAAILVDRFSYEGTLGARTRMLDWLAASLPIVCTRLTEISLELEQRGLALAVEPGDVTGLRDAIARLVNEPAFAHEMGARGRQYAERELVASVQLEPVLAWAARPARAPDGEHRAAVGAVGHDLKKHWLTFQHEAQAQGVGHALRKTRDFAWRRLRHSLLSSLDSAPAFVAGGDEHGPADVAWDESVPPRSVFEWRRILGRMSTQPEIALITCVRGDEEPDYLDWTLEQLLRQYYPAWRALVLLPEAVSPTIEQRLRQVAARFQTQGRELVTMSGNVEALGHAIVRSSKYAMLLAPGDLLRPDALAQLVVVAERDHADVAYASEQDVDESNLARPPRPKPSEATRLLWQRNAFGRGVLYRTAVLAVDPTRLTLWPFEALSYDVALRARPRLVRQASIDEVLVQIHVPAMRPEVDRVRSEQEIARLEEQALREAAWRQSRALVVARGAEPRTYRVRWPIEPSARVVLLVAASDPAAAKRTLEAARDHTRLALDPVVIGNRSQLRGIREAVVPAGKAWSHGQRWDAGLAARRARYVAVLDTSVAALGPDWLESLVEAVQAPGVAAASPKLVSPDGRVVWPPPPPTGWPREAARPVAAPAVACALYVRKALRLAGGFGAGDPEAVLDVLSARLAKRGLVTLVVPEAVAYLD